MAKINLSNVLTLLGINSNFQKVEDELNNKVLYRDNPAGEPNTMETPLDMNGKKIFNLPAPTDLNEPARLQDLFDASDTHVSTAALTSFVPAGNISASNVQGAIQELDSEKVSNSDFSNALASFRSISTSGPIINVDFINGTDTLTCGLGTGTAACKTIQGAFDSLAKRYDFRGGVPTILGVAGQTHTSGLSLQGGTNTTPFLSGVNQVIIDLAGSTINTTDNNAIFLRGYPVWLTLQNMRLKVSGTKGNLIETYGGGTHVELNGGIIFDSCPSPYAQLSATRYGRISTRPISTGGGTGYTIAGGGGIFAEAIIGGRIELEGQTVSINSGITYSVAFASADGAGSSATFFELPFSGSNITGPQFKASKGGIVDISGQTGSFVSVPNSSYLPGSVAGEMGFIAGRMSEPGTPPSATGAGTGYVLQGTEPAITFLLGTGLTTTNGATVSTTVTLATRSNWRNAIVQTNDPGSVSNIRAEIIGPTSSVQCKVVITWTATGFDPAGKAIFIHLMQ